MKLGNLNLEVVDAGLFRLDGGAMFGIIPKTLWQRLIVPDRRNRIILALNSLLIQSANQNILVNTGIGDKYDAKLRDIYGIKRLPHLADNLAKHGLKPKDINTVIVTHLHFDH